MRPAVAVLVEPLRSLPRIDCVNATFVFTPPVVQVGGGERLCVIDAHGNLNLAAGAGAEPQPGVRLASLRENRHHRPIATAEDPLERLIVGQAGRGRIAGMRVQPQSEEPLRRKAGVNLLVKEVGHRIVVECDGNDRRPLSDQPHVFNEQQVALGAHAKSADFGVSQITQKQQLRPGKRTESQRRRLWPAFAMDRLPPFWKSSRNRVLHRDSPRIGLSCSGNRL